MDLSSTLQQNWTRKRYEGEIETVVYRVCQEAVFNALKYAGTDDLAVRLFEDDGYLKLHVIDEGIGFNLNAIHPKGTGLGSVWDEGTGRAC